MMRHPELTQLSVLTFFSNMAGFAIQTTWVLYVTYRYGWQPAMTGVSLAVLGVCTAVAQIAVIGRFVKRFGERTRAVLRHRLRRARYVRLRSRAEHVVVLPRDRAAVLCGAWLRPPDRRSCRGA